MNTNRNLRRTACCLAIAALVLGSCGKKKSNSESDFDYLPVQMSKGDGWSIIDKDGKEVVKEEYPADAKLSLVHEGVYWVKQNDTYQLFSLNDPKTPVIDEEFTMATTFRCGHAAVSKTNQQIRIINTKGQTVATLPKNIKRCWIFSEDGYAVFVNDEDKAGLIDTKGNIVVKAEYGDMKTMTSDGVILAKVNKEDRKWCIIDTKGAKLGEISEEKYYCLINGFQEDKILVRSADDEKGNTIVLDKTGKKLFDLKKSIEGYGCSGFKDDFFVFENGESKFGVINDKGEVIIRAKYDGLKNIGKGEFIAKKGDKVGVINAKDATIINFDYDGGSFKMGSNYLLHDGSGWVLVNNEDKELTSFDDFTYGAESYAEYIDIETLTNSLMKSIEDLEKAPTPVVLSKKLNLKIDEFHYGHGIQEIDNIGEKVKGTYAIRYDEYVAEEKTHVEQVNDGWFTYNRTVSDGWQWSSVIPNSISGELELIDKSFNIKILYNSFVEKMVQGRKKISDNTYSKIIKAGGKNLECRTAISLNEETIGIRIDFNE